MTEPKKWVVTTAGSGGADMAAALREAGFAIEQELKEIGVFTGRSSDAVATKLRTLDGVTDVSPDTPIDIGPPGGDRTW